MKTKLSLLIFALFAATEVFCQVSDNCVANVILTGYSERAYTATPVSDQQIDLILKRGIKAPSGMNRQPWKFTVVKDEATMKGAIKDVIAGNVLIIISGADSQGGPDQFACGLATESMFIAAHGLGLGARIYGSPVNGINTNRDQFQIPEGYKAVAVLRIGNIDKTVDAVSSASPRKNPEEVVNYKK